MSLLLSQLIPPVVTGAWWDAPEVARRPERAAPAELVEVLAGLAGSSWGWEMPAASTRITRAAPAELVEVLAGLAGSSWGWEMPAASTRITRATPAELVEVLAGLAGSSWGWETPAASTRITRATPAELVEVLAGLAGSSWGWETPAASTRITRAAPAELVEVLAGLAGSSWGWETPAASTRITRATPAELVEVLAGLAGSSWGWETPAASTRITRATPAELVEVLAGLAGSSWGWEMPAASTRITRAAPAISLDVFPPLFIPSSPIFGGGGRSTRFYLRPLNQPDPRNDAQEREAAWWDRTGAPLFARPERPIIYNFASDIPIPSRDRIVELLQRANRRGLIVERSDAMFFPDRGTVARLQPETRRIAVVASIAQIAAALGLRTMEASPYELIIMHPVTARPKGAGLFVAAALTAWLVARKRR